MARQNRGVLLGRQREQSAIERALAAARSGESTVLVLSGEAGIGKTALLEHAAGRCGGMRVLRARGIESEAEIPFGSLLELLRPALAMLERIPRPQAEALEGALALRPARAQERFAVGAATLSLLASYAEEAPLAVLIDDAQWLDESSAQALLFAVRRLVADPVAVLIATRREEASVLTLSDLPVMGLSGLDSADVARLLPDIAPDDVARLHAATAGNPLALLELADAAADELPIAPPGAPLIVSARISRSFLRRAEGLPATSRRALLLVATAHTDELAVLGAAAAILGVDLDALTDAERAGLIALGDGRVEFRHPLARSAIYADADAAERRSVHRAFASVLPDRDVDLRAWHLAAAATGPDASAAGALEQAGGRARQRSAYATAAAAFGRAALLSAGPADRASLLVRAADAAWLAGSSARAVELLDAAAAVADAAAQVEIDALRGRIAAHVGPASDAHAILSGAASAAPPERAVELLAEAASVDFYTGRPADMLAAAERAWRLLPDGASARARFLALTSLGMALIVGGNAAAGAREIRAGVEIAESSEELRGDLELVPWLAMGPMFLRDGTGRDLLDGALRVARERTAVGALPFVLNLIARDEATTDAWTRAESTYGEAIDLARESGQQIQLALALAGLAWLQSRRGREAGCRALADESLALSRRLGLGLAEVWATAALGELELALGHLELAATRLRELQSLLEAQTITDADLSPVPELTEALVRLGRPGEVASAVEEFHRAAQAKAQPWSLARALRCRGVLAEDGADDWFAAALEQHARTVDEFEAGRTLLAFGERLRRDRQRTRARKELRRALAVFERLDARPWAERARAELAATGETHRGRDPSTRDDLTPQELRIALALAGGATTRETAAAMFLSPKTVEYHLRHVYQKLGINTRAQLARELGDHPAAPSD
jgi:DNA-binding CsgD family transcriptional regulator